MKKLVQIVLIGIILSGCGSAVKQSWNNFNAYFNTFYNAKQLYESGLEQNQRQVPNVNPEIPIRVFRAPTRAGLQDFEQAIETGASILLDHRNSKYVEPSIAIIGKSYFYRSEFFSALEKFQELQVIASGDVEQEAVFWQGRTYLEMENYVEGIRFLEEEIGVIENWDENILADTRVLLAQHYTARENWSMAATLLEVNIANMRDRDMRSRAYFLYGQILERTGDNDMARIAYSRVRSSHPSYDLVFNAKRKEAEVARRIGEYDRAFTLFTDMERDDKNFESRLDLQYEIARTQQMRGNTDEALRLYQRVLRNQIQTPTPLVKAKTYYGIGDIYRFDKEDFEMAAAYFDSASQERADRTRLPENFNAQELATSFGEYASVRREITEMDSLLYLGQLEPAEFDSVIAEVQRQMQAEFEEEMERLRRQQNQAIAIDPSEATVEVATENLESGFLNIREQIKLADASLQFQALWGDRPLADNWRRRAAVSGSRNEPEVMAEAGVDIGGDGQATQQTGVPVVRARVDMDDIPFTKEQQDSLKYRRDSRYYQLANVFFLSLNMPDSAKVYFEEIAVNRQNPTLVPGALYSLSEIEQLQDNTEESRKWGQMLVDEFPGTIFARRIADRLSIPLEFTNEEALDIRYLYTQNYRSPKSEDPADRAQGLLSMAERSDAPGQASLLAYEAAREYMKAARQHHVDTTRTLDAWNKLQRDWDRDQKDFEELKIEAQSMVADTTLSQSEIEFWNTIADSTLSPPNFQDAFPFSGAYWDSTRTVLNKIESEYPSSSVMPRVRILSGMLEKPEPEPAPEETDEIAIEDVEDSIESGDLMACSELTPQPEISGGIEQFMDSITYPAWAEDAGFRGEISYRLLIDIDGSVLEYDQASTMDRSGIPQAFEQAIEQLLFFEPESVPQQAECRITFAFEI